MQPFKIDGVTIVDLVFWQRSDHHHHQQRRGTGHCFGTRPANKQTYPHFEVVISDSKSKDNTKAVCEKHGATWIDDPPRNRADACNFALEQMDHDLVLFTDDDTVPPLDWVAKLVRWFDNPEVGAVGGPNFAPDDDLFGAKCADVAFCTKFMTAGTRYGAQPKGELVPITHNPGVNCAHRMANLREVGFL